MKENKKSEVKQIVSKMTIREKIALSSGINRWQTHEFKEHEIPSIFFADGPHGLRREIQVNSPTDTQSNSAVCYPAACSLAASWDETLLKRLGTTLAAECHVAGIDVLLGPGVNIKRSPLCGRNFEYFSEDPLLAGILGAAYIEGIQNEGIGACAKHYVCNNQETERFTISADVDERTLHEIYLRPFEIIIRQAKPWSLMCSYNRVNGIPVSENRYLLDTVLRKLWGYTGVIISDWAAVNDKGAALTAGLDLQMPGPCGTFDDDVTEKIRTGALPGQIADKSAERLVELAFSCRKSSSVREQSSLNINHKISRELASECIVLLKNDKNMLPLTIKYQRIAIIGYMALNPRYQGGGSSHVNSYKVDIPLDELASACPWAEIIYAPGCYREGHTDEKMLKEAAAAAANCDAAVIFIGLPESYESEGRDRSDMKLPAGHESMVKAVTNAQPKSTAFVMAGSSIELQQVTNSVQALLYGGLLGEGAGGAAAAVLTGQVNPSGKLAETFPLRLEDTPSFVNFPGAGDHVHYGERIYVGYRWYDTLKKNVLFPFGHGLSYTSFSYENMILSTKKLTEHDVLSVSCIIRNIGTLAGKETAQLYVRSCSSRVDMADKELKGFCKVFLEPGEAKSVSFSLDLKDFSYYDPKLHEWINESGNYEIILGSSSRDLHMKGSVQISIENQIIKEFTRITRIGEIMSASEKIRNHFVTRSFLIMDPERIDELSFTELLQTYNQRSIVKLLYWAGPGVTMDDLDQILIELNAYL